MGAIGIYRASMYSVEQERQLEDFILHFYKKILKLKRLLFTKEAKQLAESRHKFMLNFLKEINKELKLEI